MKDDETMNNQIKAKAILFDMDGVLVDSEAIMCESAILALRELVLGVVPHRHASGDGEEVPIRIVDRRGAVDRRVLVEPVGGVGCSRRVVGG